VKTLFILFLVALLVIATNHSAADVITNVQGSMTLTITNQGTPDNSHGDTNGGGNTLATGWTAFLFTLTDTTPGDKITGIDAGGGGSHLNGFAGKFLQEWDVARSAGSTYYQNGTSPVGTDTNTNSGLATNPNGGFYATDSHWLLTDPTYSQEVFINTTVVSPNEEGPNPHATFITDQNPWANGPGGLHDDLPPKLGSGTGESWNTDSSLQGVFAFAPGAIPTMELIYLIIPTTSVGSYDFQSDSLNDPNTLLTFHGTFTVPEPGTLTLLGAAGFIFLGMGHRQNGRIATKNRNPW
jgi:hypothetical protein